MLLRPLSNVEMWMQYNKVDNLRKAIQSLDGIIIEPGKTFSFWYLVGNPTKSRGYKLGMTLQNGQVKSGYGGGLCQLANMIYFLVIHSPLTVTERWRHGYDVFPDVNRKVPFGCGATVSYNYIDLQFKNSTSQAFQLKLWLTDTDICGELFSDKENECYYQIVEKNHRIQHEIWGGYTRHNQIFRLKYHKHTNELLGEELLTTNHGIMMYNPLLSQ